jgi:3-hydroxyisobutyrate dehydrogenase-like beta-hydroxyacid dehydrogenase
VTRPVGIVGLGRMGLPMCRRLTERGFRVVGTDRRSELRGSVTEAGARWAGSAAEVAAHCGVLVTMLPGPGEVSEIAGEVIVAMPPGSTWIDMSSATPAIAAEIARAADGRDVHLGVPLALAERTTELYAQALERYGDVDGELLAARLVAERAGVDLADEGG